MRSQQVTQGRRNVLFFWWTQDLKWPKLCNIISFLKESYNFNWICIILGGDWWFKAALWWPIRWFSQLLPGYSLVRYPKILSRSESGSKTRTRCFSYLWLPFNRTKSKCTGSKATRRTKRRGLFLEALVKDVLRYGQNT